MGLPGHRRTSGDKRRRRTHVALVEGAISHCAKCKKAVAPHCVCTFCGTYRGRQVLKIKTNKAKPTNK